MEKDLRYTVSLNFEGIKFPPFEDILVLGKRCPHGKTGVSKCLNLLNPEMFEMVEINDLLVEAILVNKRILKRIPVEKVVQILKEQVFPFVENGEIVKVDFNVKLFIDRIEGVLGQGHANKASG